MSIWSKVGRMGACISLLMYGNVMGMETGKVEKTEIDDSPAWPTMAIDGTLDHPEGEHLAEYHATAEKRGFRRHMPKDARELDRFYKQCSKYTGHVSEEQMKKLWRAIILDIGEEILCRCLDMDIYFIDKYMDYLENFITATASYPNQVFVAPLYVPSSVSLDNLEYGLWEAVSGVDDFVKSSKEENLKYTMESTHLLHVVARIDKALKNSGRNESDFLDLFCRLCVNTEYQKTPEFQAMLRNLAKAIFGGEGFTINTKP